METVKDWLCKNGLGENCIHFEENGWDEMSLLPQMTCADIEMCIKKRGHIVKFKKSVEKYVKNCDSGKEIPTTVYKRTRDTDTQTEPGELLYKYDSPPTVSNAQLEAHRHDDSLGAYVLADASQDGDDIVTSTPSKLKIDNSEIYREISTDTAAVALPKNKNENYSSDTSESENDGSRPLALIGNFNTTAVFDAEVSSQPTVNLTYIEHSEHTNVSTEPAQIITDPSLSASVTDNFKGQMEAIASWHAKRDIRFVETNAMKEVEEILEDSHWVTILGKPGEGKTAMAAHLLLKYKQRGYEPVFITAASEWKSSISGGKSKQFVVIDDMFGTTCLDRKKVNEWLSLLENMSKIVEELNGNIRIVCTNRQYIFDEIKSKLGKFSSFQLHQIVNLSSKMHRLTGKEKLAFFNAYYADEKDRKAAANDDEIKALDPPHGFPHCVEMFHTNVHLRNKGMSFFKNPSKYVRTEMYNFKDVDHVKFLVLLITLLSENQLKDEALDQWLYDNTDTQRKIIKALGIPSDKLADIRKDLTLLEGTYIERGPDDNYRFTHESLMENVAYVFASADHSLAMEILDLKYIITFFRHLEAEEGPLVKRKHDKNLNFRPIVGSMKPLAKRLAEEVKMGNTFSVSMCNALRDPVLLKEWIDYISTEPKEIIQSFLSSQANIRDNLLISLTEFSMYDAVLSILQNNSILNKLKNCAGWMDALQSGLKLSSSKKDSNVLEAFANAPLSIDPSCRLQGTQLLIDVLQNGSAKHAMVLVLKTHIEPHYTDENNRSYIHHLVKAEITDKKFERLLDLLSDLGMNMNSKDIIDVTPLDICINTFNSASTKEESDRAFDRAFCLLRKGAVCSVVQNDFCDALLQRVGIINFCKDMDELQNCLLIPLLREVAVFESFSANITYLARNTCQFFVNALIKILTKKHRNQIEIETTPSANFIKNWQQDLVAVCTGHLNHSLLNNFAGREPFLTYENKNNFISDLERALEDSCKKYLQTATEDICAKHLKMLFMDVCTNYLECEFENICTKYFPRLSKSRYTIQLHDVFTECTFALKMVLPRVCTKRLKSELRTDPNVFKELGVVTIDAHEKCCTKHRRLAHKDVLTKELQSSLNAVCRTILVLTAERVFSRDNMYSKDSNPEVCIEDLQCSRETLCVDSKKFTVTCSFSEGSFGKSWGLADEKVWRGHTDERDFELEVKNVCTKYLQYALEAVCADSNNLSVMDSFSAVESRKNLYSLEKCYMVGTLMRDARSVFNISMAENVLRVNLCGRHRNSSCSVKCMLDATLMGNCCKLLSSICRKFKIDV